MECPVATVKSRLNYARRQIKAGVEDYEAQGVKLYNIAVAPLLLYLLAEISGQSALAPAAAANLFSAIARSARIVPTAASIPTGTSDMAGAHATSAGAHTAATGAAKSNLLAKLAALSVQAKILAGIVTAAVITTAVVVPITISADRVAPKVVTFYTLNKTFTAKDGQAGTFDIALPKVDSAKPGASAFNNVFQKKSQDYDKLTPDDYYPGAYYPGLEKIGYKPFAYDDVLTLALSNTNSGEFRTSVSLYYYDYAGSGSIRMGKQI